MIYDSLFSQNLINNQKQIDFIRERLKNCPKGHLYVQARKGKTYFILGETIEGKQRFRGITKKPEIVEGLIRRTLLEAELECRLQRQTLMSSIKASLPEFNLQDEIRKIRLKYPALNDELICRALALPGEGWAAEPYEQSNYKPEERRQINSRGLRLRSKSELLISEKLYEYDIAFRYEQVLNINGAKLVPDFTIRRADGKIFIWEHEGLTNVQSYLDRQIKKHQLYASAGFVPWDNLIVTYDSRDGIIDLRMVEAEIRNKLIV